MAKSLVLSVCLISFLFSFNACIAQLDLSQQLFWQNLGQQQRHSLQAKTQCRIQQLNAREPSRRYRSEAGVTEFWDANNAEFECAGVEVLRHEVQPKGLLLPYYTNAPQLIYIVQGSGIQGTVFPGCPETYESESRFSSREEGGQRREKGRSKNDRYQKLRRFKEGDIIALPEGITHWAYNDGDKPFISVSLLDVSSENNQLDLKFQKFFLAGSQGQSQGQGQEGEREQGSQSRREEQGQEQEKNNIFSGLDAQILAQSFQVDDELIQKLQSRNEERGTIIRAERLELMVPEYSREEQEREQREGHQGGQYTNGVASPFCTMKIRENIAFPGRADVYNPRGGRISTVNSQTLPILSYLKLSAERGVLYRNAIRAPHWSTNSHSVVYVTKGRARVQVVGNQGNRVFDKEVRQGQLLVVPQNFVVVKKASDEGFEWIAFKTNDNAINSDLAGRLSAIRAMPVEVLMNSYHISREEARNLKYSREEGSLFSPISRSRGERF